MDPLILGLEGCDCESDSLNLFDVEEPSGEYKLDMSLPYSRMLASELLSLSESKKGHEVTKLYTVGGFCGRWRSLERLQKPDSLCRTKADVDGMRGTKKQSGFGDAWFLRVAVTGALG